MRTRVLVFGTLAAVVGLIAWRRGLFEHKTVVKPLQYNGLFSDVYLVFQGSAIRDLIDDVRRGISLPALWHNLRWYLGFDDMAVVEAVEGDEDDWDE